MLNWGLALAMRRMMIFQLRERSITSRSFSQNSRLATKNRLKTTFLLGSFSISISLSTATVDIVLVQPLKDIKTVVMFQISLL